MSFWKRLEKRFSRWAIPNVTLIIIAGQVMLFVAGILQDGRRNVFERIELDPGMVVQGEVWRLVTFAFVPFTTAPLFAVITWLLFYRFGSALEQEWGVVRYNLFLLLGLVINVIAVFVAWYWDAFTSATNWFLYGTVFLAFARLFPNYVIHLFFVLPIQIKWLALVAWIGYGYSFVIEDGTGRMLILASLSNYLLFFWREHWLDLKNRQRKRAFEAKTSKAATQLVHKCLVCGLDSKSSPKTSFRYCSKCDGQACYCPEHIRDHEHITEESAEDTEQSVAKSQKR